MRGLIYKELALFCKTFDKRGFLAVIAAGVFILYQLGEMGGIVLSAMIAIAIAMQNTVSFLVDEKSGWDQYQLALPVSGLSVVGGKYLSSLCTVVLGMLASVPINLIVSLVWGVFHWDMWGISLLIAALLPLCYLAVSLPVIYWFGRKSADIMRLLVIFPLCFGMGYLMETGSADFFLEGRAPMLLMMGFLSLVVLMGLSMMVSLAGYRRKR